MASAIAFAPSLPLMLSWNSRRLMFRGPCSLMMERMFSHASADMPSVLKRSTSRSLFPYGERRAVAVRK